MFQVSTVQQSGQVLVSHHCRVSSMPYSLHLNMMIRQMVSRGLVYPLRVSRLTYTAPKIVPRSETHPKKGQVHPPPRDARTLLPSPSLLQPFEPLLSGSSTEKTSQSLEK